jgi:hypothetical protein
VETTRTLAKVVDLAKLHSEFAAQSLTFKGLCASTGLPGDVLRIIDADDLTSADIDAIIAVHTPPTVQEIADRKIRTSWPIWTRTVTVSGAFREGDVFFPFAFANTNYFVTASVIGFTGSPPADASVIVWTKFVDRLHGFLAAPPGVGNSVTYEIAVFRVS